MIDVGLSPDPPISGSEGKEGANTDTKATETDLQSCCEIVTTERK